MLNHDQNNEQAEVKNEMTEETSSVNNEQESIQSTPEVETPEQETTDTDVTPVAEEPMTETEPAVVPQVEPASEPIPEEQPVPEEPIPAKPKAVKSTSAPAGEQSEMMKLLQESESNLQKGTIVEGTVVNITDKEVMVDIGYKSEGIIPIAEFAHSGIPVKNQIINVYISEMEDGEGKLHLSKKRADFILNSAKLRETFQTEGNVEGIIRRRVKGGMIVDLLGIEAFLPGSQMSLKPIPNLDQFINKTLSFKIVSLDLEKRNIILSRKKVLEEEILAKRKELLSHIEIGSELEGEVKNITQYGAFIDLGGIDGLLHLTDMSWGKINHPAEMLNIGDKLKIKVINYDAETGKISLGLKQLVPHPWEHIEIKYPEGTRVSGKVVSVKSYGAFIEIEPGVEGLVHISEMSWTKKITDARRVVKVNDTINAIVLELNKENKRISLGMKQMEANPWLTIEDHYPIGTVVKRKIKSMTNFGVFVEIEDGIDGLIHISDISWTKRIYHPKEVYKKNQEVEAIVLSIDRALHRVALGVKQLKSDPWETLPVKLPVNTEIKGKISKLIPKGVLIDVNVEEYVVEGFVPISHLAIPKLEHSEDAFHIGEELPLKVIELDTENRRLILSVKAFFFSRDPKLQEEYIALHEQYIRDRIIRLQKKKADIDNKQRNKAKAEETEAKAEEQHLEVEDVTKPAVETIPEMETAVESQAQVLAITPAPEQEGTSELEASVETEPTPEPVVEDTLVAVEEATSEPEPQMVEEPQQEVVIVTEEIAEPEQTVTEEPVKPEPKKKAAPKKAAPKKVKADDAAEVKEKKTTKAKTSTKKETAEKPKKTVKAKTTAAEKKPTKAKSTAKTKKTDSE